ncbi:hemerythrin domain-containing protein [Streptomyces sp. NPDC096934]|uniref:hemerythrin domain-containing protein n=1 Tax=Streptomyces sp. NPDC096934 TaxID=3155551 RepID=UPI00331A10F7
MSIENEPMSIVETRLVHDTHRVGTTLLADAALRPEVPLEALAQLRDFIVENLRHHHESEDHDLWPRILAVAPAAAQGLNELSGEHEELEAALGWLAAISLGDRRTGDTRAVRTELHEAAAVVRDTVHEHLSHEEPFLFPALRDHVSSDQWEEFSQQVLATTPTVAAHLAIGFFDEVGTPEEVDALLVNMPEPVRQLIPAIRQQAAHDLRVLRGAA